MAHNRNTPTQPEKTSSTAKPSYHRCVNAIQGFMHAESFDLPVDYFELDQSLMNTGADSTSNFKPLS
jgi:hypothetical protein